MTPDQINQINLQKNSQPWFQQWLASKGINPNQIHLNDAQKQELQQVMAQNGIQVPQGLIIDNSGNVGEHKGYAGYPTWAKIALAAAPIAATAGFGAAGMGPMAGMFASSAPTAGALGAGELSTTLGATGGLVPGLSKAAPSVASKTGDFMSKFLGKGGAPEKLADTASIFGNYAGAQANNRSEMANLGQNYDRNMLTAQQDRRANETDAMKKIGESSYILGGGSQFKPPTIDLNGMSRTAPNLGFGPQPISQAQKDAATTLQAEMMKRLQPGGSYTPTDPAQYAKQGFGEKAANTGSLILGGLSAVKNIFGF